MATRPPPSSKPLVQRLQLKAGRLLVLGLPDEVAPQLREVQLLERVPKEVDAAMVFAEDAAGLERAMAKLDGKWAADPVMWVCYPKGGANDTDLNRDRLWELLAPRALRPVAQISVTDVWSALRFRRVAS